MLKLSYLFKDLFESDGVNVLVISEKLGVAAETVQHGVEGLIYLLTESSKLLVILYFIFRLSM